MRSGRFSLGLFLAVLCLGSFIAHELIRPAPAHASADNRTIQSITITPDASFDNDTQDVNADSGIYIRVNLSGADAGSADENPDNQGGVRVEIYNSVGALVRRRVSMETGNIDFGVNQLLHWNGQGDSFVRDTLPYGSYTVRAYSSLKDPTASATVTSQGVYIDRPGDMHVSTNGVLTWVNTGVNPGFCQVALNDPNTQNATFIRRLIFDTTIGATNTDKAYGLTVNSSGKIYVSDNQCSGSAMTRIMKYDPSTETWIITNGNWFDTTANLDEIYGLGICKNPGPFFDSVVAACATSVAGGGAAGLYEGVLLIQDTGTKGYVFTKTTDQGQDYYDVAPSETQSSSATSDTADSGFFVSDYANSEVDTFTQSLLNKTNSYKGVDASGGGPTNSRSIWTYGNSFFWVTNINTDSFSKYGKSGNLLYTLTDVAIDGAAGICVWYKSSTNETFVIVGGQNSNEIAIYKENAAGNGATFVRRVLEDDYYISKPIGIAIDLDSNVYVVSRATKTVKKYDKDGNFVVLTGAANGRFIQGSDSTSALTDPTGFNYPGAIAVDTAGFIYVFDQDATTGTTGGNGQCAIKRFSSDGTADASVWFDLDTSIPGQLWNGEITMAIFASGNIYGVSRANNARLFRIGLNKDSTFLGAASAPTVSRDVLSVSAGPMFDSASATPSTLNYYPTAIYIFTDQFRCRAYPPDLSKQLFSEKTPANPGAGAAYKVTQPFLADKFGAILMIPDVNGTTYTMTQYNSSETSSAPGGDSANYCNFGTYGYTFPQGNASLQLNAPRQALWLDNAGDYKFNSATGKYEQKFWVNDSNNNRLKQFTLAWNDVQTATVSIAKIQDTPIVVSATFTERDSGSIQTPGGDTLTLAGVRLINGSYYVNTGTCTMFVNFNHTCVTGTPDTIQVQFKPSGGSFTHADSSSGNRVSWNGLAYTCTMAITSSMADGNAEIKVTDPYDNSGTVKYIDPNPDQTDFDATDDFKPFVIDKTAPVVSVTAPPSTGDTTSASTYSVSGSVTSEATGLDASITVINWTALTGGTQFDSASTTALVSDGSFSRTLNLQGPPPTSNYIEVVAIDKLGNRQTLSPRRLVTRQKNAGSAYILPSSETVVASPRYYTLTYTAGQDLSNDSLQFTMPGAWSQPQKSNATTAGYVTVAYPPSVYTDSIFNGQTVTLIGVTRGLGQTINMAYGDSTSGQTGLAKSTSSAPLDDASNTFLSGLEQPGETVFTNISAAAGQTLTVPLRDSALSLAIRDTGPGGNNVLTDSVVVAKGSETKVITLRFFNTNVGAHTNRVTQVLFAVESDTGDGVTWVNTASKVVVKNTAEAVTFATITTMPSSSTLTIAPSNFTIDQGQSRDMEFWVTFSSTATPDTVRFYFTDTNSFTAVDSASGKSLTILEQETRCVGKRTGEFDIIGLVPADTLLLGCDTSIEPLEVATGQKDVTMMDIKLTNGAQGANAVNAIRVDQMILSVRDSGGFSVNPAKVLRGIHLKDAATATQYGGVDTPSLPNVGDTISISLSGLTIGSGATVTVRVFADPVNETVTVSKFRLRFLDTIPNSTKLDTSFISAKDQVTQATISQVRDNAGATDSPVFQTDTITIAKRSVAGLASISVFKTDSTLLNGGTVAAGANFLVALRCTDAPGGSSLRVIPSDTDLKFSIAGVDKTSEFTVVSQGAKTITPGGEDTFTYSVMQNLGSSTGLLVVQMADTGRTAGDADTRPRFFDAHDFTEPDKLRADFRLPDSIVNFTLTTQSLVATAMTLDTTFANPAETAVPIIFFRILNQAGGSRIFDSIVIQAISADSAIKKVRLYRNDTNMTLSPSDSAAPFSNTLDSLYATGTLSASDSRCTLVLSPSLTIASGGTESFFIAFDFDNLQTDGDTFDAQVPTNSIFCRQEAVFPAASFNSTGGGWTEVVATRVTQTPDTQIVAVASSTNITLKALDRFGNLDNVINYETSTQGNNIQVQITVSDAIPATDTNFSITATSGMTGVTPTPANSGISSINGNLASGQGQFTVRDTSAETVAITLGTTSNFTDSTGAIQYANLITASVVNLIQTDSPGPDSRAVSIAKFRVVNQSGMTDQVTTVGVRSLNASDSFVSAVILFRDANGNELIDSGVDVTLATSNFTNNFVTFSFLTENIFDQDSKLFMIGYNIGTTVTDGSILDAQVDTVVVANSGNNIASQLNSSPPRNIDVHAARIKFNPTSASLGTGSNQTVSATAVDSYGNTDIHYTGGSTKCQFSLTGVPTFDLGLTTPAGFTYDPTSQKVRGNLSQGVASLVFTDATEETPVLTASVTPGLPTGTSAHDTGAYTFQQGLSASTLAADQLLVNPGDTNIVLLSFKISAQGVSDTLTGITATFVGTDTRDLKNVRLFRDVDANDTFLSTADTVYGAPQSIAGSTCTFVTVVPADSVRVNNGTTKSFFLVADMADTAKGADTIDVQLLQSSITTQTSIVNVPNGTKNSDGYDTVARVPDTFRIGIVSTANRNASESQAEIIPMTLQFSSPSAADRKFYAETIAIEVEGVSGGKVPSSVIQSVKLRNQSSLAVYLDTSSVPASGDSIVLKIPFDATNPMLLGGPPPETITVDVVLAIANSVTQNDTFRLRINAFDTGSFRVFDHPKGTVSTFNQKNNVTGLNGAAVPLLGAVVTVQKQAIVTQQAIRTTDISGNRILSCTQGVAFKVEVGLQATSGRADAQVKSADTDLTFKRANGATDITSEFTIQSRDHSTLTDLVSGNQDTIIYTVIQGNPFSGAGETLVINNFLSTDTGPFCEDKNSASDNAKLRVYVTDIANSTDAVRIDSTYATVTVSSLSANDVAPDSKGTRIFGFIVTDLGPRDTMTGVRIHLATPAAEAMIKSVWIAIDTNKNGVYDSTATGGDTYFGSVKDFKTSDTAFFIDTFRLYGSSDTREFWVCINLETSVITDSTQIQVEVPIDGLGFSGASSAQDSLPKSVQTSATLMRTIIVGTKLQVSPDTQNLSAGAGATLTIQAQDSYGNLNTRTTNFAATTITATINDTAVPDANKSTRWTSTTLANQSPASLPTAAYYDTQVSGKLTAGVGTVTLTDTQAETVAIFVTQGAITGETVTVSFTANPSVSAVSLTNLTKVSPDSTDAVILQCDVSFPFTATTIDSLYLRSENTFDSSMKRLRLWADSDASGTFSTTTDSNIDTAAWSAGTCSFLVNRNFVKAAALTSVRLFVTAQMETSPQNDNDSLGCRIDTGGIRLTPGGFFPTTGEVDAIVLDTQNEIVDIDATQTGGLIQIFDPGQQNKDLPFEITLRPVDHNGNVDRVFSTLGSSGSKDITFSAAPAGLTINSTSMTETVALPATSMRARFKIGGGDTINMTPSLTGAIVLTADMLTPDPADTTLTLNVVAGGWSVTALSLSDFAFTPGDTGQVLSRVVFKNLDSARDTLTRIDVADTGSFRCETGIKSVALWMDSNGNNTFDTGVDSFLANGTFTSAETAAFDITRGINSIKSETYFVVASIQDTASGTSTDTIRISYVFSTCSTARFGRIPSSGDVTHTDSLAFTAAQTGDLFASVRSVAGGSYTSGSKNVVVGYFIVQNTRTSVDSVQTIVVKNDTGAHQDTGLRVKIFIDGDSDGIFDGTGVDTPFGGSGVFVNRVFSRTDSARIGSNGDTRGFFVLFDLSDTLTQDSQVLRVYIDTGGITTFVTGGSSDSAESVLLRSSGSVRTNLAGSSFLGESVLVSAGAAVVLDTVYVSVSVRDTFGAPLQGKTCTLYAPGGTFLTASTLVTDSTGLVLFGITSPTAGVISCTVAIDTGQPPAARPAAVGYANFLSLRMVGDTQFSNNTQHATNTGTNRKHMTAPSFDSGNANNMAYGYYNNNTYTVYKSDFTGAPSSLYSSAGVPGLSITAPAPDWASNVRVRNLKGTNEAVVFGGYSSDSNFGTNLYYQRFDGVGGVVRVSPNDTRTGTANAYFDTDAEFGQFDVSPTGETIVCCYTGQLCWWRATGSAFSPGADSKTLQFVTTLRDSAGSLTGGFGWNGAYIQYPSWSPDGKRIAFTVVYRNNGWAGPSDTAEIYVLYNLGAVTAMPIPFQRFGNVTGLPITTNPYLVKITSADTILFAWQPQWSRDGSVLFFSGNNNTNFDYEVFNQTVNPQNAIGATGVDFNTYMVYYDKTSETVPYRAIPVSAEAGVDEIVGEMSASGDSLAIMREPSPNYEEVRTARVASVANVTANGGVLFDSGRVSVVIRENESFGKGFTISAHAPDTPTAPTNDSIIVSGVAKLFFNPDTPTAPVYFSDSVIVFLYYKKQDFTDTDLLGYDGDGDGIPDRTENSIGAYYWNGTNWILYPTVRFPAENKIQFWTNHFSEYAIAMPAEARALAFGGSVNDVIAYPNPWRADGATAGLATTNEAYGIKLTRMPGPNVRVRVYTITGELVNDATVNAANGTSTNNSLRVTQAIVNDGNTAGTVSWNLKNNRGRDVASGVYLIILEGPGGKAVRKVAVIR